MEKLLAIVDLGQRAYGRWLFQRLLPRLITAFALIIIISILISAMVIAGLVCAYFTLLSNGIGQLMGLLIVGVLAIMIIVMLIITTLSCLSGLRQIPKTWLKKYPITSRATHALNAFLDGLMAD